MNYRIVQPFLIDITGNTYKEAVKNFIKINQNLNLNSLIFKDQNDSRYYQALVRYYTENNKNKVGINFYPYNNSTIVLR